MNKEVLWYGHSVVGSPGAAGGSIPGGGATKLSQPKEKLAKNMAWVEDFSQGTVRLIGALEVVGAIGLVLPALTRILLWLTPLAALGLVLLMIGAALTHLRRREYGNIAMNAVLLVLAAFVAYGRFFLV
jgi:uncharacterized membrane protein YphA (DoxX/SURF4 family)